MVYKIHLDDFMEECPVYWQNFMESFPRPPIHYLDDDAVTLNRQVINDHLRIFGGWYICNVDDLQEEDRLQFHSKEDATFFILRWS